MFAHLHTWHDFHLVVIYAINQNDSLLYYGGNMYQFKYLQSYLSVFLLVHLYLLLSVSKLHISVEPRWVSCIAGRFFTISATRGAHILIEKYVFMYI